MEIIKTVVELQTALLKIREQNKSIGFVPTMGALHRGHIELVKQSVVENTISIVSIFVNPTQFNDKNDLLKYPRTLNADCKLLLQETNNHFVFAPSVEEIYSETNIQQFKFGHLETVMEGKLRPGHFNGVAQVVSRLFKIVKPNCAYFGEKDFQQLTIIRTLVRLLNLNVKIIPHPTVREPNGLALSSRNIHLTPKQKKNAGVIFKTLSKSRKEKNILSIQELKQKTINKINCIPDFRVEYFDLVDGNTLQSITDWKDTKYIVGCIAVYIGEVRLIDNITY
ncbi:MAG: pantoate--beta-alanine ligase [Candidatus Azobacteroides pseudotrichonymphae]|jgi:pantoate--beta-alanine ligase|nr:pantoate--beta-alanine ligase [Bacteroidales bacterium OttesenSCG-928-I14]GMO33726.1 MAG: pantoate--beta-alanine ligase [Candidatus Azobacteroides pseudotrichonymphae]